MRALAVLTVRNEGAFLVEWLAHHKAVGFTDFLVFSNDCTDGTDDILDRLQQMGELTHIRNDGPHEGGVQWAAMKIADRHPLVKQADWIMTLDVDEFVNIHVGDHTLQDLWAALPDATAITLTWRLFGNNGVAHYEDRPVTDQFPRAAPVIMFWPWRASMFKTLYRNDGSYRKLGVHRPRSPVPDKITGVRWFDGAGRELPEKFHKTRLFSNYGQDNYSLAQLNHYPLGAMENYILKADRGRAVHDADRLGMDYWTERNYASEEDLSIGDIAPARDAGIAELRQDAKLDALHIKAAQWRKSRFAELMEQEPMRALFGRLLVTPPARPVPLNAARFLTQFANKARAKSS